MKDMISKLNKEMLQVNKETSSSKLRHEKLHKRTLDVTKKIEVAEKKKFTALQEIQTLENEINDLDLDIADYKHEVGQIQKVLIKEREAS